MILGVIGPSRIVQKFQWVANDISQLTVFPLTYETMLDAPRIAEENQSKVEALYFVGTSPYFLAARVVQPLVPWHYLERPIDGLPFALISARDSLGKDIKLSIDTFTELDIEDTLRDVDFHIDAIYTYAFNPSERYDDDLLKFHLSHYQNGHVNFCLTCAYTVYKTLLSMGVPVFFVEPTVRVIRKALLNSLQTFHATDRDHFKLVVGLFSLDTLPSSVNLYEETVRAVCKIFFAYAKKRDILIFQRNPSMFQCVQTYSQFRLETDDFRIIPLSGELRETNPDVRIRIGYGLASNIKSAELYAERALDMARNAETYLLDGEKGWVLGSLAPVFAITNSDPVLRFYSQKLNVTPATFSRYLRAFKLLRSAFSSVDFSAILGLQPKSARKILSRFLKEGLIVLDSYRAPLAKGRPESLYRVHPEIQKLTER